MQHKDKPGIATLPARAASCISCPRGGCRNGLGLRSTLRILRSFGQSGSVGPDQSLVLDLILPFSCFHVLLLAHFSHFGCYQFRCSYSRFPLLPNCLGQPSSYNQAVDGDLFGCLMHSPCSAKLRCVMHLHYAASRLAYSLS